METKFFACYEATSQVLIWLKKFISSLKIIDPIMRPLNIFYDNSTILLFSKNNKSRSQSKHIDIKFLVVEQQMQKGNK